MKSSLTCCGFLSCSQITTLVNHKDNGRRSEKARKAIHEIGKVVAFAVDRFVSVGEQIAEENEDVASEMRNACEEAKKSGQAIFDLTSTAGDVVGDDGVNAADKSGMVRAARSLLSAVTRVLIIADSVVVKRLLKAVKKVRNVLCLKLNFQFCGSLSRCLACTRSRGSLIADDLFNFKVVYSVAYFDLNNCLKKRFKTCRVDYFNCA